MCLSQTADSTDDNAGEGGRMSRNPLAFVWVLEWEVIMFDVLANMLCANTHFIEI